MTTEHRPSIVFVQGVDRASSQAGPRAEPALTRWTARFVDPKVEAAFLAEELEDATRPYLRFTLTLATIAFLAYAVHDALVVPSHAAAAIAVRFGLFVPVAALTLAVVSSRHLARWHQPVVLLFGMTVNLVVLFIGAIAGHDGFFLYTAFAILFVTLGPFVGRMAVATQVVYTLSSMALYDALDVIFTHSPVAVRASMNVTFFSLGAIGALVARQMEAQARRSFVQRRVIQDQLDEIERERERSDALLLNILPPPIARRLKRETRAIAEGFADATILFADIVGFTKMSARLTPEELVRRLNQMFSAFDDMADELGLQKIKTIGDAYMVAGGLHDRHASDHALAVAEMALRMQAHVKTYASDVGEDLSMRVGIHTGPVVAGVIGKRKFIYDVWGDTVNTASRMESHGVPGAVQVSDETRARLEGAYDLEDRGMLEVKGKGPMRAWVVRGPRARA